LTRVPEEPTVSCVERVDSFFHDPKPYRNRSYNIRPRRETVRERVGDRELANILDIGCGEGTLKNTCSWMDSEIIYSPRKLQ
jgi:2-polyprenyl-3-methyl-5-hydroxy-6-metoxy-1,4-benzoquinol methylase